MMFLVIERMHSAPWIAAAGLLLALSTETASARPIASKESTMAIADYRDGAMAEAQLFYAPTHYLSFGIGHMELDDGGTDVRHSVSYLRVNWLAKRWNMANAQANIFVWGGLGSARLGGWTYDPGLPPPRTPGHDHIVPPESSENGIVESDTSYSYNGGGQIDYETRRIYVSFKTDMQYSDLFKHRADTLQFGYAPYEHDTDSLATWFVVSGRNYDGDMHEDTEVALLLRFFKKRVWVEAGATLEGKIQAMAMFNF